MNSTFNRTIGGFVTSTAAIAAAASLAADLEVWPVDALEPVLRNSLPPEKPAEAVEIHACRGEIENGQIAVRSCRGITNLTARASALRSFWGRQLEPPQVRFVGYVSVSNTPPFKWEQFPQPRVAELPADLPDPLLEDSATNATNNQTAAIWLTIDVPQAASAGAYRGDVVVCADGVEVNIPLKVTVYPAALPAKMNLKVVNWYYPVVLTHTYRTKWWDEKFWQLIEADARSMRKHRQSVGHIILNETIVAREDETGAIGFDFSNFDKMAEIYRNAGLPYLMGSAVAGRNEWLAEDFYAIPLKLIRADGSEGKLPQPEDPNSEDKAKRHVWTMSEEFEKYVSMFLPALQKHLEEKGWLDSYIQLQADEPVDANAKAYRNLGRLIKGYAPKLRRAEANCTTNLVGALDIWAPGLSDLDANRRFYAERQAAGDELWFYTCMGPRGPYMNRFIDYKPIATRLLHWANYHTRSVGYLHWGFNPCWGNPFANPGYPPGDAHLVYPGVARLRGAPDSEDKLHSLESIRYEAMRDGIEDYELLRLLASKAPEKADAICRRVVRTLTDYTLAPAEFGATRRELLNAVSSYRCFRQTD